MRRNLYTTPTLPEGNRKVTSLKDVIWSTNLVDGQSGSGVTSEGGLSERVIEQP